MACRYSKSVLYPNVLWNRSRFQSVRHSSLIIRAYCRSRNLRHEPRAYSYRPWRMKSAARSAIMMMVALVLARTMSGMTEASTTLRPSRPWTLQYWSTTAVGSESGPHLAGDRGMAGDAGVSLNPVVQRIVIGQVSVGGS